MLKLVNTTTTTTGLVSRLRRDEDVTDLGERDAVRRLAALAAAEAELLAVQREDLLRVRVRIRGKG